jgi:hypothetical protein
MKPHEIEALPKCSHASANQKSVRPSCGEAGKIIRLGHSIEMRRAF